MVGAFIFPHIFVGFRKAYPQIELDITEAGTVAIRNKIERGQLDVGIIMLPCDLQRLDAIVISSREILLLPAEAASPG